MGNKIFKLSLENLGHYEVRILPNINDLKNIKVSFKAAFGHMGWNQNHIIYALINGEIKVFVCGNVIMRKIGEYGDFRKQLDIWNLTKGLYLDINTSEDHGFLKVDIEIAEDKKYNFDKNREYIENLFQTIRHIKLEDVLYQELFLKAELKWKENYMNKEIYMKNVYEAEYPDFEERYKSWLRSKKIKQIIG